MYLPPATPLDVVSGAGSAKLVTGRALLTGLALRETTGTAGAVARLHDGESASRRSIIPVSLAANESVREVVGLSGALYVTGVFIEVVSGSVEGSVFAVLEIVVGPNAWAAIERGLLEQGEVFQ